MKTTDETPCDDTSKAMDGERGEGESKGEESKGEESKGGEQG